MLRPRPFPSISYRMKREWTCCTTSRTARGSMPSFWISTWAIRWGLLWPIGCGSSAMAGASSSSRSRRSLRWTATTWGPTAICSSRTTTKSYAGSWTGSLRSEAPASIRSGSAPRSFTSPTTRSCMSRAATPDASCTAAPAGPT